MADDETRCGLAASSSPRWMADTGIPNLSHAFESFVRKSLQAEGFHYVAYGILLHQ